MASINNASARGHGGCRDGAKLGRDQGAINGAPTVLVTGAAGFIGSHTVERLLDAGCRVIGVDNLRTGKLENLGAALAHDGFRFEQLDVLEEGALDRLAEQARPDAVLHLAALVSVPESIENPEENFRLNVLATETVAACARRHRIDRLVFASSAAVYGTDSDAPVKESSGCEPKSPYGAAKLASEALLLGYARAFGLTVRCQRYFNVYGPRQDPTSPYSGVISRFAANWTDGTPIVIHGDGGQTRDFISVRDVAEANWLALAQPGIRSGVANICTGERVSLNTLADTFQRITGRAGERRYGAPRSGDIRHSVGAPELAAKDLGFRALVPLERGLAAYLAAPANTPARR